MKKVDVRALLLAGVAAGLIAWVTALGFYGDFPPIKPIASTLLWIFAAVCAVAGYVIRRRIAGGEVGMDTSQLNPVVVAQWLILGQAVAWIGAVLAGVYVGIGAYVLPHAGDLVAAEQDVPGVIAGALGAVAAAVAGVWLERGCEAPPPNAAM
ncbi:MAG TPA: DUF3180 domain-containing protein [Candidatus Corynebacterium gallistercoris]|uniref:DUF3180 domain-containing protein n=1 Tax=Candidatus Corynebacterium gallistercoris TaxID=2838530 RepID=A0A9D1RWX8_9CORY|nr:DUF3180 domain-containing protein [Candidatus Corynebacterium gallistercoris]